MSAEVRVLGATIVLAALLTGFAWWLSHHRTPRTHEATHAPSSEPAPWLVWAAPPITSRDATTISDTPLVDDDAGPSTEARDRLGALLVAQICARREECLCGAYPSPYAEGRETATTCEADVLADFLRWWSANVTSPVRLLADDVELERQVWASVGCTGTRVRLSNFVESELTAPTTARLGDASGSEDDADVPARGEGDRCVEQIDCGPELDCVDARCVRFRWFEEPCGGDHDPECNGDFGLVCIEGRCDLSFFRCKRGMLERRVAPYEPPFLECIPTGSACRYNSDCGWDFCEGEGRWTCGSPGPHARPAALDEIQRCGDGECAPGLTCDFEVAAGGHCQPLLCRQATFFPGAEE